MPEVPEQQVLKRQCPACGLQLDAHSTRCPRDGTLIDNPLGDEPSFEGKYEYLGVIGKGGMGVIYKARQIIIDKLVAIKMIHPHLVSVDTAERFQLEAKAIGMLSHPFIVTLHDFGVTKSGQPYMIMDYVEGKNLDAVLARDGQLNKERFLRIFIQVCDAVAHAHKRGVMHRDLKPSNIMLVRSETRNEEVRIMDFGIAKLMSDTESNTKQLTKTGEAVGSPLYMSPEQAQGQKTDARTDLYSLGCVMYESLSGSPPFIGNSELDTLLMHINEPPVPLKEASLGKEFDPQIEAIVMKLLEKDPSNRYQSMSELSAALTNAQSELAPQDAPSLAADRTSKPGGARGQKVQKTKEKNIVPYVVGGIAVVALGAGGLFFMTNSQKPAAQPAVSASSPSQPQPNPTGQNASVDQDVSSNDVHNLVRVASAERDPVLNLEISRPVVGRAKVTKETLACFAPEVNGKVSSEALSIRAIKMPDFGVTDNVLEVLTSLPLTGLDVSGNPLKDMHALAKMPTLERLNLARTNINSEGMVNVGKLKKLQAIDLSDTQITNEDLKQLYGLKALKELRISNCANIKEEALKQLKDRTKCQITQGRHQTEFIPFAQIEASTVANNWDKAQKQIAQMLEREESALVKDYGTIALLYQKLGACFEQQYRVGQVTSSNEANASMAQSDAAYEKAAKVLSQHFPDSTKATPILMNAAEVFEDHNRFAIESSSNPQREMKSQAVRQRYLHAIDWRNQTDRTINLHSSNGHLTDLIPANDSRLGEDYCAVGDTARAITVFARAKDYWDPDHMTKSKGSEDTAIPRATLDVLIANAYFDQNKTNEALRLYEQIRKIMDKNETDENRASLNKLRWNVAQAYVKLNRPADAEEALLSLEKRREPNTIKAVRQRLAEVDLLIRVAAQQKKPVALAQYNQQRADLTKRLEEMEGIPKAKTP